MDVACGLSLPGGAQLCLEEGEAHPNAGAGALPEREERQPGDKEIGLEDD